MLLYIVHSDLDDDHFDVQSELRQIAANWKSIGFALRLKPKILDDIQARNSGHPPTCLASIVTEWLMRNYNVKKFGEPTWQQLVKAVGHPAGGANMALARMIANRHKAEGTILCGRLLSSVNMQLHFNRTQSDSLNSNLKLCSSSLKIVLHFLLQDTLRCQ